MDEVIEGVMRNSLFKGLLKTDVAKILNSIKSSLIKYSKNEIIAYEDDICTSLGLIINGAIVIERLYPSGKEIVMKKLKDGDVFGEALIFSNVNKYPATVMAAEDCKVLYLPKDEIIKLFSFNTLFMKNFMELLSEKIFILNSKIKSLSFKTVNQKVANYILQECILQKTNNIKLKGSKEDVALYIGIPRPSLSRELIKFRDKGIIEFDRSSIKVLNIDKLEEVLFE